MPYFDDDTQAIRAERDAAVCRVVQLEDLLARVSTVVRDVLRTPAAGMCRLELLMLLVGLETRLASILGFPPDELCGEGQLGFRRGGIQGEWREPRPGVSRPSTRYGHDQGAWEQ